MALSDFMYLRTSFCEKGMLGEVVTPPPHHVFIFLKNYNIDSYWKYHSNQRISLRQNYIVNEAIINPSQAYIFQKDVCKRP